MDFNRIVYDTYLKRLYPKDDSIHMIKETLKIHDDGSVFFFFRTLKFYDNYWVGVPKEELIKIDRSFKINKLKEKI